MVERKVIDAGLLLKKPIVKSVKRLGDGNYPKRNRNGQNQVCGRFDPREKKRQIGNCEKKLGRGDFCGSVGAQQTYKIFMALEVRKTRTSVRNPRDNGQVEHFNRTLLRMMKSYLCGEQKECDWPLGYLAGAYRATPNESTGMTPHLLTIRREVRLPAELVFASTNTSD